MIKNVKSVLSLLALLGVAVLLVACDTNCFSFKWKAFPITNAEIAGMTAGGGLADLWNPTNPTDGTPGKRIGDYVDYLLDNKGRIKNQTDAVARRAQLINAFTDLEHNRDDDVNVLRPLVEAVRDAALAYTRLPLGN